MLPRDGRRAEISRLRDRVLAATDTDQAGRAYEAFFKRLTATEMKELKLDPDLGISLQAGWELSRKPLVRKPAIRGRSDWIYDPKPTRAFAHFMAGKANLAIPGWWSETLRCADFFPGQNHAFFSNAHPNGRTRWERTLTDNEFRLVTGESEYRILAEGKTYTLPMNWPTDAWDIERLTILARDGQTFLAPYGYYGGGRPFKLFSVDKSGRVRWRADVWATRSDFSSGMGSHDVSLVLAGDRIAVFGAEDDGAYAEEFRVSDGHPIFRFCTAYWSRYSERWGLPWGNK